VKKTVTTLLLSLFLAVPVFANETGINYDQAREDYKVYLEQLKKLGAQYKELTGEMRKVMKEEGVPTFDVDTGAIGVGTLAGATQPGEIRQTDKDMTVVLEMPGVKKNSIQVKIRDNRYLHVSGLRKADPEDLPIEKTIELPAFASDKGPKAKYEDGVLTVTIQKSGESGQEIAIPVK
jgi:HSP20 family molecular chaperone IbpA